MSGRSDSLGGGGLGGGLTNRFGIGLSGKRISGFGKVAVAIDVFGMYMLA